MQSKEEQKEYHKQYYLRNKEKILKQRKEYNIANKEKVSNCQKINSKKYYNTHKEKINKQTKVYWKQYYSDNDIKLKEYQKEYRNNNKEKIKKYKMITKEHRKQQRRNLNLKQYNITPEQYNEILNKQEGRCSICGKHQSELKRILFVDHNHKTGKIRGLLCNKCNFMLGNANDDVTLLLKAIKYLNDNDI